MAEEPDETDDGSDCATADDAAQARSGGGSDATPSSLVERSLAALDEVVGGLDDGEEREGQRRMCELVSKALATSSHAAVEAGTGVGKSLAYLVPAVLHDGLVVVSTATKQLQEQLRSKDLPLVAERLEGALGRELQFEVLKGRNNYLCRQRLVEFSNETRDMEFEESGSAGQKAGQERVRAQAEAVLEWSRDTPTGDVAELSFEPDADLWRSLSVTPQECPGRSNCAFGESCFTELARTRAADADVAVVNHALYVSDMQAEGNVLPEHEVVVVDEAHQFASVVDSAAGVELSESRFSRLVPRGQGSAWGVGAESRAVAAAGRGLRDVLRDRVGEQVAPKDLASGRDTALVAALELADGRLEELRAAVRAAGEAADDSAKHSLVERAITELLVDVRTVRDPNPREFAGMAMYVSGSESAPVLRTSPLDVAEFMQQRMDEDLTVVLTSATLGKALPGRLGLGSRCTYEAVDSPFDFKRNSLLYVPMHLPEPRDDRYERAALGEMEQLIGAIGGRAMVLCTSIRARDRFAEELGERADDLGVTVLRQGGQHSNSELIERMMSNRETVVCATMTFWQGVDLPGDALQLLVLDKLPFPYFRDPLFQARETAVKGNGGNPFFELSVPHTSRMLAQGLGRLIRTTSDRGVAAVLDSRLATARYKDVLLESVPPMKRTVELSEAVDFLRELRD